MQFLSVLMGLIQALVFSLLAAIYIKEAMPEEEEHL
jgi:F0F1-type ATP synthase membrane subunit a